MVVHGSRPASIRGRILENSCMQVHGRNAASSWSQNLAEPNSRIQGTLQTMHASSRERAASWRT